jgi:hypothetical protein
MNAKRRAVSLLLGVLLAACAGKPTSPPPAGSPHAAVSATPVATSEPTIAPSAMPAATIPTPPATPSPVLTPSAASPPPLSPTPTPTLAPPKPTGATFHEDADCLDANCGRARLTQTVIWRTPRTEGIEIRVYGVMKCLAEPKDPLAGTSGPCLVEHTALPSSVRTLLATVPASDGVASWTWTEETGCNIGLENDPDAPPYYAVVLAAYSASRHSIFTIAEPGAWWRPGPDDIVC